MNSIEINELYVLEIKLFYLTNCLEIPLERDMCLKICMNL